MSYKANANIFTFIIHSGIWMTCIHLDWGSKYDFRSHQKLQPHQIDHHIETNDEGEVQITGIRFDIHKRWHVDWISSTTGCHIRPMQTFSLLSFILESGWPCIHLDWGSKYDFRSQQLLFETRNGGEVQTGNDYGRGADMRLAKCKLNPFPQPTLHRIVGLTRGSYQRCFMCCLRAMCGDNSRNWMFCSPRCDGFCSS